MKTVKQIKVITIKKIDKSFAKELSELLSNSSEEYTKYFTPFNFGFDTILKILSEKKYDLYFGLFINETLAGFYMLRGFDEGYSIPSYGVFISEKYTGKGLSTLTLQHAIAHCRLNGIRKIMLKVHPDNHPAKHIYQNFGFEFVGIDTGNKNLIFEKKL
ncbi:MAG: hypothetical protein Kow0098_14950 [Ignavibacteriaceae bacterium]